jgi:energy-coupling factor transport system substrate-specific component
MMLKNATLRFGRRELIATLVGMILYAATSWVTNFSALASGDAAGVIRPSVAVPIFFGFVFGPIVGFLVGFGGNLMLDFAVGFATLPTAGSTPLQMAASLILNWEIGNGLMGLIPGIYAMYHRRYYTVRELFAALLVTVLAVIVGIGFAGVFDPVVYGPSVIGAENSYYLGTGASFMDDLRTSFDFAGPIILTNALNAIIIIPILLFNYERLNLRPGEFLQSGLMRRLLGTILLSAAVPIALLTVFLVQATLSSSTTEAGSTLAVQLAFTIGLTFVFIISNAALMAQSLTRPLLRLTEAAVKMEASELSLDKTKELQAVEGSDEISQLSRLFGTMAQEVIEREESLRARVQELEIMIDTSKRDEQVGEIVDSEFFQDLKDRAQALREESKKKRGE